MSAFFECFLFFLLFLQKMVLLAYVSWSYFGDSYLSSNNNNCAVMDGCSIFFFFYLSMQASAGIQFFIPKIREAHYTAFIIILFFLNFSFPSVSFLPQFFFCFNFTVAVYQPDSTIFPRGTSDSGRHGLLEIQLLLYMYLFFHAPGSRHHSLLQNQDQKVSWSGAGALGQ